MIKQNKLLLKTNYTNFNTGNRALSALCHYCVNCALLKFGSFSARTWKRVDTCKFLRNNQSILALATTMCAAIDPFYAQFEEQHWSSKSYYTDWILTASLITVTIVLVHQHSPRLFSDCQIFIARQHTDTRYWYSKSVRLSVCPSVTFRYQMKTA